MLLDLSHLIISIFFSNLISHGTSTRINFVSVQNVELLICLTAGAAFHKPSVSANVTARFLSFLLCSESPSLVSSRILRRLFLVLALQCFSIVRRLSLSSLASCLSTSCDNGVVSPPCHKRHDFLQR